MSGQRDDERPSGTAGEEPRGGASAFLADVGGVLAAWLVLLAIENLVVGIGYREHFVGSWEMAHARMYASPIAFALAPPLAALAVAIARLAAARRYGALAALAFAAGAITAYGVSTGRHLASPPVRAAFIVAVGAGAGFVARLVAKRLPLDRPRTLAAAGVVVSALAWLADAFVMPRLYPAFHAALLGVTLGAWALLWLAVRAQKGSRLVAAASAVVALGSAAWTPRAARALVGDDNLRRVLVEHAPILGPAILVAARIAPPAPLDEDEGSAALTAAALKGTDPSAARALDWADRDIVVVTIDALRADHVSAYGYGRRTTPNIDRLAEQGTRFERAYCPTPHTSYSVTSMLTGKYMRPLLVMNAPGAANPQTWADLLVHFGYRTAAFYPPALFFIDESRFKEMQERSLGFEYKKEEFADPSLRRKQIADYVANAPLGKPLFLWVHLFEPHEPYVRHPEHPFPGDDATSAYDSEIALSDSIVGDVVRVVEQRRPGAVFVVSADHGEELGDHGGRYHGTTVYEEQVRVPLVVVGPGVAKRVVSTPVQTIDLLPTTLRALDIPVPARVRGRDLGPILAGKTPAKEEGLAFAETDDYTLVARGDDRLVCVRKIASCTLFDVATDPGEKRPVADRPARVQELRRLTAAIERENGKLEASSIPEALRLGLQGDRDAAEDVAALLDDARVDIRREAARCLYRLEAKDVATQLRRAASKDEDPAVKTWARLSLVRLGEEPLDAAKGALEDPDPRIRAAAGLALAARGDGRGEAELVKRFETRFEAADANRIDLIEERELVAAFEKIRAKSAVPALVRSLDDVRLRVYVAAALGAIGDAKAREPLLAVFAEERYEHMRETEARALVKLGAKDELRAPLARFLGMAEPLYEAIGIASRAGLLAPKHGGWAAKAGPPPDRVEVDLGVDGSGPARLVVLAGAEGDTAPSERPTVTIDGRAVTADWKKGGVWFVELPDAKPAPWTAKVVLARPTGVDAAWIVRRSPEIPPPPPK
ncbi:MAG: sulfatase-like hydrolase/transferase [Deltaproteobacteria bacterium]|nr:sulfatase-like hydrolase/transferase [Deltaproteobacteria bacterium]